MQVQIAAHTLVRAQERGTNETEIADVIETGMVIPAKQGRLAKAKVYPFDQERLGKHYEQKRVEVIYLIENEIAVTITVYVFYGKWGE
jgi:hypothetical protein